MTTRSALHDLVDGLPDDLLDDAQDSLARLAAERERREAIWRLHDEAAIEAEPLSPAELRALERLESESPEPTLLTEDQFERLVFGAPSE